MIVFWNIRTNLANWRQAELYLQISLSTDFLQSLTLTFLLELYYRISRQEMFIAFGNEHLKIIANKFWIFLLWNNFLLKFHLKVSSSGWVWRKLFLRVGRQIHETGETFILGKISNGSSLVFFSSFLGELLHCEDMPPVFSWKWKEFFIYGLSLHWRLLE